MHTYIGLYVENGDADCTTVILIGSSMKSYQYINLISSNAGNKGTGRTDVSSRLVSWCRAGRRLGRPAAARSSSPPGTAHTRPPPRPERRALQVCGQAKFDSPIWLNLFNTGLRPVRGKSGVRKWPVVYLSVWACPLQRAIHRATQTRL